MVKAWYFDNDETVDYREPHQQNPPVYLSLEDLYEKTGVEYFKVHVQAISFLHFCLSYNFSRECFCQFTLQVGGEKL